MRVDASVAYIIFGVVGVIIMAAGLIPAVKILKLVTKCKMVRAKLECTRVGEDVRWVRGDITSNSEFESKKHNRYEQYIKYDQVYEFEYNGKFVKQEREVMVPKYSASAALMESKTHAMILCEKEEPSKIHVIGEIASPLVMSAFTIGFGVMELIITLQ